MANGGSWDVRDGTMRPVYAFPTPQVQPQQRPSFDGPSPAEYAAWNSQNPSVTLDRFGESCSSFFVRSVILRLSA
jgi:hypothetical protein